MSNNKRFITAEEFRENLDSIRKDVRDLYNCVDSLDDKYGTCKEAININSDGCMELETKLSDLAKRVDKYEAALRSCKNQVSTIRDNGNTAAWGVIFGFAALCMGLALLSNFKEMEKTIKLLKEEKKRCAQAKPFCEANACECGSSDNKSTSENGDVSETNGKEN